MFDWIDICLLVAAAALFCCGVAPALRAYRSVSWVSSTLLLITALFPRHGNTLGEYLFATTSGVPRLPVELFGVLWWIMGAWLVNSLLELILRRTIFPDDNRPHARRLFADLASVLVYVVALVGIMDSVFKVQISGVLATSGVLAIVVGLALQNTLADVFSGLAINIERPFTAGDWITVADSVGQVIEINWRATRIRTPSNDLIVIPNSIVTKAIVINHRRLNGPHLCTMTIEVDQLISPTRVIDALQTAASGSVGIAPGSVPTAHACGFTDASIAYELVFAVDDFTQKDGVQSEIVTRVIDAFHRLQIQIGTAAKDVRLVQGGDTVFKRVVSDPIAQPTRRQVGPTKVE